MASSHSRSLAITLQGEIKLALLAVLTWVRTGQKEFCGASDGTNGGAYGMRA